MTTRILQVVTNTNEYLGHGVPTGLWLGELATAWQVFEEAGYEQRIVSPFGGPSALDPASLEGTGYDLTAQAW